jgi:hypothetical protein
VAKRYGCLPSELLSRGSNLDVYVGELSLGYEVYMREKAENDSKGLPTVGKKYNPQQLQAMLDAVKTRSDND